jgi:hypothetical protein
MPRVCQLLGHIAIVGKKQQSGSIAIEPAYRINPFATSIFYQHHHCITLLRIINSSYVAFGLIQ